MKQKTLVLSLLGALSLYGCTLDAPLKLGVKCSDEEHGLSAVIFNRTICHPEDVTGEQKEVCGAFADAFKYGHCPLESPICIEDEAGFTCSVSNLTLRITNTVVSVNRTHCFIAVSTAMNAN
jgi:hypothetical protein